MCDMAGDGGHWAAVLQAFWLLVNVSKELEEGGGGLWIAGYYENVGNVSLDIHVYKSMAINPK